VLAGTIDVNEGTLGAGIHESLSTVADVHVTSGATMLTMTTVISPSPTASASSS
jgi:hypothetical protein